jgi:hypothetical protein
MGTSQKSCARHFLGHREEVMRSFGVKFGLVPGRSDKKTGLVLAVTKQRLAKGSSNT